MRVHSCGNSSWSIIKCPFLQVSGSWCSLLDALRSCNLSLAWGIKLLQIETHNRPIAEFKPSVVLVTPMLGEAFPVWPLPAVSGHGRGRGRGRARGCGRGRGRARAGRGRARGAGRGPAEDAGFECLEDGGVSAPEDVLEVDEAVISSEGDSASAESSSDSGNDSSSSSGSDGHSKDCVCVF